MKYYKIFVLCSKLLTCLIVQRSFDKTLHDYIQKYHTLNADKLIYKKNIKDKDQESGIRLKVP